MTLKSALTLQEQYYVANTFWLLIIMWAFVCFVEICMPTSFHLNCNVKLFWVGAQIIGPETPGGCYEMKYHRNAHTFWHNLTLVGAKRTPTHLRLCCIQKYLHQNAKAQRHRGGTHTLSYTTAYMCLYTYHIHESWQKFLAIEFQLFAVFFLVSVQDLSLGCRARYVLS